MEEKNKESLEDFLLNNLFKSEAKEADAEIVDIAKKYSLQLNARQIKALLYLDWISEEMEEKEKIKIKNFIKNYLKYKEHNASASFIIKILENISLKKFLNENSFKVNIEK